MCYYGREQKIRLVKQVLFSKLAIVMLVRSGTRNLRARQLKLMKSKQKEHWGDSWLLKGLFHATTYVMMKPKKKERDVRRAACSCAI